MTKNLTFVLFFKSGPGNIFFKYGMIGHRNLQAAKDFFLSSKRTIKPKLVDKGWTLTKK